MAVATGVVRPLVEREGRGIRRTATWFVPFVVGALASSVATGFAVANVAAKSGFKSSTGAAIATATAVALVVVDAAFSREYSLLSLPRQTCSTWFHRWPRTRTFFVWGIDLGLGFSTFRVSALYWVILLWVAAQLTIAESPLVLAAYALGLAVAVAYAALARPETPSAEMRNRVYLSLPVVRWATNGCAMALVAALIAERSLA